MTEDDYEEPGALVEGQAMLTLSSAGSLYLFATILFVVITIIAVLGVGGGFVIYVVTKRDGGNTATAAITVAISSLVTWLTIAVPCVAAQAVARYIEFRVNAYLERQT